MSYDPGALPGPRGCVRSTSIGGSLKVVAEGNGGPVTIWVSTEKASRLTIETGTGSRVRIPGVLTPAILSLPGSSWSLAAQTDDGAEGAIDLSLLLEYHPHGSRAWVEVVAGVNAGLVPPGVSGPGTSDGASTVDGVGYLDGASVPAFSFRVTAGTVLFPWGG